VNPRYLTQSRVFVIAAALVAAACADSAADGAQSAQSGSGGGASVAGGAAAGRAGRGARGGGPSIVLAASDVHTVSRGTIESTTPISGDLRPIEEIGIRARVEGDLIAVMVREGETVRAGTPLAKFDTAELDAALAAAKAEAAAARGDSATAFWNLEQSRELLRAGAISEQAFRATEQAALAAQARLAGADARLRSAELARRDAQVVAPATGTISQRLVQTGERVSRGMQMFVLVRDDSLEFTAALAARAAALVKPGQEARFTVDGRNFVGRVARVSPAIDPASRSVAVYVRVPNRARELKANAFASGRLVSGELENVLYVPVSAIRRSRQDEATFVYRIDGNAIAVAPVRLGASDEARGTVEIVEGLEENDRVVIGNVGTIGRGMQVQVLDADRRGSRGGTP
jgi:membrane fusion protein (multidrug efflux system)